LINKFNEQNQIIEQLRVENSELEKAFHEKTMEAMDLKEQLEQNKSFDSNQKRDLSLKEKKKHGKNNKK
jgi:predicted nuclease with TOPRIM domain